MTSYSLVEEVFEVKERCVLFLSPVPKENLVRQGASIELRRPHGPSVQTQLDAVLFLDHLDQGRCAIAVTLPPGLSKQDVPIGTEIWLTPA